MQQLQLQLHRNKVHPWPNNFPLNVLTMLTFMRFLKPASPHSIFAPSLLIYDALACVILAAFLLFAKCPM